MAGRPCTVSALAFTGITRPGNPAAFRFASTLPPTLPGSRDAPITATARGRNSASSDDMGARQLALQEPGPSG